MFAGARTSVLRAASRPLAKAAVTAASRTLFTRVPICIARYPVYRSAFAKPSLVERHYSVLSSSEAKLYKYEDVKELVTNPEAHPDTVLIDVREPVEFAEGHIPGAHNVPFKSSPGALDLSEEEFEEIFGFPKPAKDKELVFYCLGGVRSAAAEELANTFGYTKRGNYVGSWEDWVARENTQAQPSQ
ncbi:putative thiosulfate sulfurtransferase [Clavispora lusitaniae]|uniref:Rhodanese domain-containing protein n=3 Tax=Clavispora lusitaniae TaxID=36911 RepID=C4Y499_CLAL4|nr:uncharacterized protein CLUG_02471 [Clavispora lusitaniae ATCC 42720]KAF7580254.1 Rhodanese-like domain family protein [Clavispora lusitaniae]EEQ38345.1 hypothetical protein CLUG_02471 [Clavispora lusitaniae ATCC 42720]OVF04331.1 putative thiosulfate sulfurtransferase [Clavispora lusitaniae]QFZ27819.1 putative thiosulfate sulfurtransferase [Clavispora lusitaniae]QFZ32874.1 putative thiosulfate sulfurtransferase [Clavispora lusitaniae]